MHLFARTDLGLRPETSSYCDVTFYCYGRTRLQRHDKVDTPQTDKQTFNRLT